MSRKGTMQVRRHTWIHWNFTNYSNSICPRKAMCLYLRWLFYSSTKRSWGCISYKGYFLIVIDGGITGEVEVNDTSYHLPIKAASRNIEMQLMLNLWQDPKKIPSSSRNQMMELFHNAWEKICSDVDNGQTFKSNMMTLALDGSEDHFASKRVMDLVGKEMLVFREQLLKSTAPATIKELHSKITQK